MKSVSLSVNGGLKEISSYYEVFFDASIEISRQEVYLVFAIMKTIIEPQRKSFLTPIIFLVILEPGGLIAPVHIYLQCEGCWKIIFTVSWSTGVLQSLHGFLVVLDDLIPMKTVDALDDNTDCIFVIPPV